MNDVLRKNIPKFVTRRFFKWFGLSVLFLLVFFFLLYTVIGFWGLPWYIKSKAQDFASETLHRELTLEKVTFNPYTFRLNMEGFSLSEPDSAGRFVSFDRLYVAFSPESILKMTPVVTEFKLVNPFVRLVRVGEDQFNFDDIAALFRSQEEEVGAEPVRKTEVKGVSMTREERRAERRKRKFGIYNVQIEQAHLEFDDRQEGVRHVIRDFTLRLPYVYRGPIRGIRRHVEPHFEAVVNGRKLEVLQERPSPESRDAILRLDWNDINLKRYMAYVPLKQGYKFEHGRLDLDLEFYLHRPRDGEPTIDLRGKVGVRSLRMTQDGKPLAGFERLEVVLGTSSISKGEYVVEKLELDQPQVHLVNDRDGILNVTDLLAQAVAGEDTGDAASVQGEEEGVSRGIRLLVEALAVRKAQFRYEDQSVAEPLDAVASNFDLSAAGVTFDTLKREISAAQVKLPSGSVDVSLPRQQDGASAGKAEDERKANGDSAGYVLKLAKLEMGNWSVGFANRNTDAFSSLPVSARIGRFGVAVSDAEMDFSTGDIRVGNLQSANGTFDVVMHATGSVLTKTGKNASRKASSFSVQMGRLGVENWSGKIKNTSAQNAASIPFSAVVSRFGMDVEDARVDLKSNVVVVGAAGSTGAHFDVTLDDHPAGIRSSQEEAPAYSISLGRLAISNWDAKIRNRNAGDLASLPGRMDFSKLDLNVAGAMLDMKKQAVSVDEIRTNGGSFYVHLSNRERAASSRTEDTDASYKITAGRIRVNGLSGQVKRSNRRMHSPIPFNAHFSRLDVSADSIEADMQDRMLSIGTIQSGSAEINTEIEPYTPTAKRVAGHSESQGGFVIALGQMDISGWTAGFKNRNAHDHAGIPFSARANKLALSVSKANIDLKKNEVSVGKIESGSGHLDARIEPYTASVTKNTEGMQDAAPAGDGMKFSIDKFVMDNWSARVRNRNPDDRLGPPVSGSMQKINMIADRVVVDTKKKEVSISDISSSGTVIDGYIAKYEKLPRADKPAESGKPAVHASARKGYVARIGNLALHDWAFKGVNNNVVNSPGVNVTAFSLKGRELSTEHGKTGHVAIHATVDKTGTLMADGRVGFSPLNMDMSVNMKEMNVVAIQPYIDDYLNLTLTRANLSLSGHVTLKENTRGAFEGGYRGDIAVTQLRTMDKISNNSFVRWDRLAMTDVNAQFMPFFARVSEASLDNFFARVILNADGTLNLHDIVRKDDAGPKSLTETESELDAIAGAGDKKKSVYKDGKRVTAVEIRPGKDGERIPLLQVDRFVLSKGRVNFTDNFIRPHYSANITELSGTITELSSDTERYARLDLRGLVNNAPLTVAGSISPFKEKIGLDINAHVRGMELAQFSSYTTKYIGYGINKGKLSFDVEYRLDNGVLVAQNRLILEQLTFGERAPGEPVTSLPVELAVSLLKDGNGVIDIDLPVGGSLEDPEFSIGGILARVFLSSIKRVILAPFAFLSARYGSGEELGWIDFPPGSSEIQEGQKTKLEALAQALAERPELKLDVTGRYDPVADKEGLARAVIQRKVRALKRQDLQEKGQTVMISQLTVSDEEYPALLERVYKEEDFSKPRNFIGFQKKLSVGEMEKLMVENYAVTEEQFLALANHRSERAKAWLVEYGRIPDSRIFLLASKPGENAGSGEVASRVDFAVQ